MKLDLSFFRKNIRADYPKSKLAITALVLGSWGIPSPAFAWPYRVQSPDRLRQVQRHRQQDQELYCRLGGGVIGGGLIAVSVGLFHQVPENSSSEGSSLDSLLVPAALGSIGSALLTSAYSNKIVNLYHIKDTISTAASAACRGSCHLLSWREARKLSRLPVHEFNRWMELPQARLAQLLSLVGDEVQPGELDLLLDAVEYNENRATINERLNQRFPEIHLHDHGDPVADLLARRSLTYEQRYTVLVPHLNEIYSRLDQMYKEEKAAQIRRNIYVGAARLAAVAGPLAGFLGFHQIEEGAAQLAAAAIQVHPDHQVQNLLAIHAAFNPRIARHPGVAQIPEVAAVIQLHRELRVDLPAVGGTGAVAPPLYQAERQMLDQLPFMSRIFTDGIGIIPTLQFRRMVIQEQLFDREIFDYFERETREGGELQQVGLEGNLHWIASQEQRIVFILISLGKSPELPEGQVLSPEQTARLQRLPFHARVQIARSEPAELFHAIGQALAAHDTEE